MNTNILFAFLFAAGCASSPVKSTLVAPQPAPAASDPEEPAPTDEVALTAALTANTVDGQTKCQLRGSFRSANTPSMMFITSSASVDTTGDAAIADCLQATFAAGVRHKFNQPAPAAAPAPAKVVMYDFDDQVIQTPGSGEVTPTVIVDVERRTKTVIHHTLRDAESRFANCAAHAVSGTVTIQLAIGTSGAVTSAQATTHVEPAIDACVVGVARDLVFPPSKGVTMVRYPIAFQ